MIIAFGATGPAFAGKTTFCQFLGDCFPSTWAVKLIGFGDALKIECARATGIPLENFYSCDPAIKDMVRPLLQWWGTEFKRNPLFGGNDNYWVEVAQKYVWQWISETPHVSNHLVAFHDIRFGNEVDFVHSFKTVNSIKNNVIPNLVVKINPVNGSTSMHSSHVSEAGLLHLGFDTEITNDHSKGLLSYRKDVKAFYNEYFSKAIDLR